MKHLCNVAWDWIILWLVHAKTVDSYPDSVAIVLMCYVRCAASMQQNLSTCLKNLQQHGFVGDRTVYVCKCQMHCTSRNKGFINCVSKFAIWKHGNYKNSCFSIKSVGKMMSWFFGHIKISLSCKTAMEKPFLVSHESHDQQPDHVILISLFI